MSMISVFAIESESIVDGNGLRVVLFGAGCIHGCLDCHNPPTWDINNGNWISIQEAFECLKLTTNHLLDGVTFSGGDPMFQAKAFTELAKMIKAVPNKDIWCYTGYLFEDLISCRDEKFELLKLIDVLVDGRYVDDLRDSTLAFRGSSNQRIIDVQASLNHGRTIDYQWGMC